MDATLNQGQTSRALTHPPCAAQNFGGWGHPMRREDIPTWVRLATGLAANDGHGRSVRTDNSHEVDPQRAKALGWSPQIPGDTRGRTRRKTVPESKNDLGC